MRLVGFVVATSLILASTLAAGNDAGDKKLPDAATLARQAAVRYEKDIASYTCTFEKTERIGDRLVGPARFAVRFREKPFSVHMRYLKEGLKGREVVFVEGKYDGKIMVKTGIANLILAIETDSARAMRDNRHPITRFGVGHLARRMREQFETAAAEGTLNAETLKREKVNGRDTWRVKRVLADGGTRFWNVDTATGLPIVVETFDAKDALVERYRYLDFNADVELDDDDFDVTRLW